MDRRTFIAAAALVAAPATAAAQTPAEIFAAIRARDAAAVTRLLTAHSGLVKVKDANGVTPLIAAAYMRDGVLFIRPEVNPVYEAIVPWVRDPDLFESVLLGATSNIAIALDRDPATAKIAMANGRTLLHIAAYKGDIRMIDRLLDAGAAIDAPAMGVFGSPPILQAILGFREAALLRLIARGANVNITLTDGSTPMHEAGLTGQNEMVRALAKAGAVPDAVRQDGRKPRDLALAQNHPDTAALLDELTRAGSSGRS